LTNELNRKRTKKSWIFPFAALITLINARMFCIQRIFLFHVHWKT